MIESPVMRPTVPIARIKQAVAERFGLSVIALESERRDRVAAWPRQLAMHVAREITGRTYRVIGRHFGYRDHTTVMHACRAAERRIRIDAEWAAHAVWLRAELERETAR